MTIQLSVAARNGMADAIETAFGASPILKLRTGAMPASCATADSGTVVATMNLPADAMANAASGAKALSGTWQDASADNTGIARHFRLYASDGTTCHIQGLVSEVYTNSKALSVGQQVSNANGVYVVTTAGTTAGSGTGPTGTGTGITDGTAVFSYVQAAPDMTIDNTSVNAAQSITVTAFTLTMGNA